MAKIEIKYRDYRCNVMMNGYDPDLQCEEANTYYDNPCDFYHKSKEYGYCECLEIRHAYLGKTVNNYKVTEYISLTDYSANCAIVTIGRNTYYCDEVKIDGKIVYPKED